MLSVGRLLGVALSGAVRAIFTGFSFGIVAPLRRRNAGLVALAALGMAVWTILKSSR